MPLSERAWQLIPKARIISCAHWPYQPTAIAIWQQADDLNRYLSDTDLDTIVNLELDLLVYSQQARKLRDNANSIVDNARQTVLSQFYTILQPGGDLYPPYRAEACWRDFWNFLQNKRDSMDAKAKLLELIAGRNRGLLATESDRVQILAAIEQLEDHNPHPHPLEVKQLLGGNWRLLFTSSRGLLGLDRLPFFQLGQIYQYLDLNKAKLYNIAEIIGVPWLEGAVIVSATFEPTSERRVMVKFERSILGLQRLLNYHSPQEFIEAIESGKKFPPLDFSVNNRQQTGWLDITYLDEDLRIGRGSEGSVFILAREKT